MKTTFMRAVSVAGLSMVLAAGFVLTAEAKRGDVSTWLGAPYRGDGGDANSAFLDNPKGFTADSSCNFTIADSLNNVIRRIDGATNVISTIAGDGNYLAKDGAALKSSFRAPQDVALGPNGETYVVDTENGSVRILRDGVVSTWLKNLKRPKGIALNGSTLYVSDTGNNRIVKADVPNGSPTVVTNIAKPGGFIPVTNTGAGSDTLFVTYLDSTALAKVNSSTGEITKIKDGLTDLDGVAEYNGKIYFVASDRGMYNEVWMYDPATGEVTMLVHVVETEWYNHASDILFCQDKMYLLFSAGSSIFKLNPDATNPVKIAGVHRYGDLNGAASQAMLGRPKALVLSKDKQKVYILENHKIKVFNLATRELSFIAGSAMDNWRDDAGTSARMSGPTQMVLSPDGKKLYFADRNNNRIRTLVIDEARLETITGAGMINQFANDNNGYAEGVACPTLETRGVAGCAYFSRPMGIAVSKDGKTIYVADTDNHRIRTVNVATGATALLAGSGVAGLKDGKGSAARFRSPTNLLLSKDGKKLYVLELGNHTLREINLATKQVRKLIGSGKPGYREGLFKNARLSYPDSLALGPGSTLFLSEVGSQRIRKIDLVKKTIRLAAGSGQRGSLNGPAKKATFHNPRGLMQLNSSYLLVADQVNDLIRAIKLR